MSRPPKWASLEIERLRDRLADPTVTATKKRNAKKASSGVAKEKVDPYICPNCNAWQFNPPRIHAMICSMYRNDPRLGEGNARYYEAWKADKAKAAALEAVTPRPRKRKKIEKDHGI